MPRRVNSELLLVGSLPADSAESALRSAAGFFGELVFALPDGETGARAGWVSYERERLVRPNEGIVTLSETASPTGLPRHAYETPVFGVKPGISELHWESWPRIDDALASYAVFRELRAAGVIPDGVRFQVCLPFPASALNAFKADFGHDYPIAARGFEDLVARELARLFAAVPPGDVALQWDLAYETQDLERVLAWTPEGAWERFAGPVTRLTRLIPADALVGYHLCYGTFPEWPMYEARDMDLLVRMANFAVANSGRTVDWLHLAGPRYLRSQDRSFFRPLVDLEPQDARVFLGIVLPIDGEAGLRRRVDTASRYISDFGVAMYCGFGRQPGKDGTETMREHAEVVAAVRGAGKEEDPTVIAPSQHEPTASEFATALKRGDADRVRELLADDPSLATTEINGYRPLHLFADAPGHRPNAGAIVTALVAAGADLDAPATGTWHHETALHWAASNDDVALIDVLLDAGADIEHPGSSIGGGPPSQSALGYAQWAALRRLHERGATMSLAMAAALGLLPLVTSFAEGVPSPGPDEISVAFWNACRAGQLAAARYLLARGADLNWPAPWSGETPLDAARARRADNVVAWLAAEGATSGA